MDIKAAVVLAVIVASVFAAFGLIGSVDKAAAERTAKTYCEMVELGVLTNGALGWPDFDGNAATNCPFLNKQSQGGN